MKLCIITNYTHTGYTNEPLIFKKLSSLLDIKEEDTFDFLDLNSAYKVNKEYTHALILFNYKITSIEPYKEYLEEVTIPRIFIIDTICHKHEELNKQFNDIVKNQWSSSLPQLANISTNFTSLSQSLLTVLYKKYSDGLIFFSELDKELFKEYYFKALPKPTAIIPPSLGKKEDIKIDFSNLTPNTLIGYNGSPSFSNGIGFLKDIIPHFPNSFYKIHGSHGREDLNNELLFNILSLGFQNLSFGGRLKNYSKFYFHYHIYFNPSLYDSFNYFTFLSLLNGMVPVISKNTGTSSYFKSYPFIAEPNAQSIRYIMDLILKTPTDHLKNILSNTADSFKELSDENIKEKYQIFLNTL